MKTAAQIAKALTPHIKANNAAIGETNRRIAKLGDGNGNTQPPTLLTPRDVYYHSISDAKDQGVAILHPKCPIPLQAIIGYYDMDVWVANAPGSAQVMVVDIADASGFATDGPTPMEGLISTAALPTQDRLVIMRIRPADDGGRSVFVDAGPYAIRYQIDAGTYGFFSSTPVDLSDPEDDATYIPTTTALSPDEHRILGIALNPATGSLIAIPGDAQEASDTLPQRSDFTEDDYLAIDFTGYYPAGYVYDYYGQTDFEEDDCLRLYDPRPILQVAGASVPNGGNGFLQDRIDVHITIPAKFQALYANRVEVLPGGRLTTEGRGYVIRVTS